MDVAVLCVATEPGVDRCAAVIRDSHGLHEIVGFGRIPLPATVGQVGHAVIQEVGGGERLDCAVRLDVDACRHHVNHVSMEEKAQEASHRISASPRRRSRPAA